MGNDDTTRAGGAESASAAAWQIMAEAERRLLGGSTNDDTNAAIQGFEDALELGSDDPTVATASHLAIAQILGPDASDVDTETLERAVTHARAARDAAKQIGCPEPAYSAASAALGTMLVRVADRRPADDRNLGVAEAIEALRDAVAATPASEPKLLTRQANLAAALCRPMPDEPRARLSRLGEAVNLFDDVLDGDLSPHARAVVLGQSAHALQQRTAAARACGEHVEARDSFERARSRYRSAIDAGEALGIGVSGTVMGLARLLFEAVEPGSDDDLLDEAIRLGSVAVDDLVDDVGFEREAAMQLAEMHTERLRRHHGVVDAALADELSRRALHNWYHEHASIELTKAKTRRCDVLCVVALSDVATDDHLIELDKLLTELYPPPERTAQMDAIGDMAAAAQLLVETDVAGAATTHAAAVAVADHFEELLTGNDFVETDPAWWPRWFALHHRTAQWAEWIGLPASVWMPPLVDSARRLDSRLQAIDDPANVPATARMHLADTAKTVALHARDPVELRRALDLYEQEWTVAQLPIAVATSVGLDASYLSELAGDTASARRWIQRSRDALERSDLSDSVPLAARVSVDRQRYELAGSAAALADDPHELAWTLHSTVHPIGDADRADFRDTINELSRRGAVVYLAQSRRRCRATLVIDGHWSVIELTGLALDHVGAAITTAHRAHALRSTGRIGTLADWETARAQLTATLDVGLAPLADRLVDDSRPIALHLSGWLHAAPTAATLMALTQHARPIAVSLGLAETPTDRTPRPTGLVALASPGGQRGSRYLAHVADDVDTVAALTGGQAIHDATVADTTDALRTARQVLIACHGESADEAVLARLALHDGDLTAAQILDLDLNGLELAVVAACEALSTDRVAPEHPFNVQTAMLRAGADATCGPLWRIDDDDASLFCRTAFAHLADGATIGEAHRVAVAAVVAAKPDMRDIALVVRTDTVLLDNINRA